MPRSAARTIPRTSHARIALARGAGFANVNIDLIYGTPGESLEDWTRSLAGAIELGVEHVSAYALTVEPGTPLGQAVAAGRAAAPDDDDQADKYVRADEMLTAAGFEWYEISNWAQPGRACRHNQCYWTQGEYLAVGCAAHGHTDGRRWWNVRTPERYVDRVASGASTEADSETLEPSARDARKRSSWACAPRRVRDRSTVPKRPRPSSSTRACSNGAPTGSC